MKTRLFQEESGSVAIEFAILALPFMTLLFSIVSIGYHALLQSELDRTATSIALQVSINANKQPTSADFISNAACAKQLGTLVSCTDLRLGATTVVGRMFDYRNVILGNKTWNLGCAGDTVIIELTYPFQQLLTPIVIADIVTDGSKKYYRSRAVIKREPVIVGEGSC